MERILLFLVGSFRIPSTGSRANGAAQHFRISLTLAETVEKAASGNELEPKGPYCTKYQLALGCYVENASPTTWETVEWEETNPIRIQNGMYTMITTLQKYICQRTNIGYKQAKMKV